MIKMSELTVKVEIFEGPLDLLLHLIKKMEIDITDIPIVEIVKQYMTYLNTMKDLELTIAGDYLVMAATLLSIKSSMLLPQHEEPAEDEEIEDPRSELVDMLLEYKKFKEAAGHLREKEMGRKQYFTKPPAELNEYQETIPLQPGEVTVFDLMVAFQQVDLKMQYNHLQEQTITREEISIEDKIQWIRQTVLSSKKPVPFSTLLKSHSKQEMVTTFLAMLELMKEQKLIAYQKTFDDELEITFLHENQGAEGNEI